MCAPVRNLEKGLLLLAALLPCAAGQDPAPASAPPSAELVIRDSEGHPMLYVPREEELVYRVNIGFAGLSPAVGVVTQTAIVEPYQESVFAAEPKEGEAQKQRATLEIHAVGSYTAYQLDSTIQAQHLPTAYPRIVYTTVQDKEGASARKRVNRLGIRDGEHASAYQRNTSKGAPKGTRIWKEEQLREVPPDTLDMLSAVFACRTLVREGRDEISFPMIDKDRLWELKLERGEERRLSTPAGAFDAVEILLHPEPWADEEIEDDTVKRFEGLFGMRGAIRLFVEKNTGVPLEISGDLPVGPLTLGIVVVLEKFSGTPEEFSPVTE